MAESRMLEYGRCPCTGVYERRTIDVRVTVRGEAVELAHVAQGVCPLCGSRVYKVDTLKMIEDVMRGDSFQSA